MSSRKFVIMVVLAMAVFSSGCASLQDVLGMRKPTASLQGVKFQDIGLEFATLIFDVEIENPYSAALPLVNLDYELAREAVTFLSGKADIQSTIPANGRRTVALPAKISYMDIYNAFKDVRPGSIIPYKADLGLSVDAPVIGMLRLPIKKDGELAVPDIPKISDLDWQKMLLEKINK